jgi:hypothetical protein
VLIVLVEHVIHGLGIVLGAVLMVTGGTHVHQAVRQIVKADAVIGIVTVSAAMLSIGDKGVIDSAQ